MLMSVIMGWTAAVQMPTALTRLEALTVAVKKALLVMAKIAQVQN